MKLLTAIGALGGGKAAIVSFLFGLGTQVSAYMQGNPEMAFTDIPVNAWVNMAMLAAGIGGGAKYYENKRSPYDSAYLESRRAKRLIADSKHS